MSDIAKYLRTLVKNGPSGWIQISGEDALKAADEIEKLRAALQTARRDALEEAARVADATAHANRVEYPVKWKDRPEGIPHDWQQAWETCAETAEDIAAAIRALGEKE